MVITQPRRLTQPSLGRANWRSPLTQRLCFLWSAFDPQRNVVDNRRCTTNNTTRRAGAHGMAAKCAASQINVEWPSYQPMLTSDGAGTGDFTMIALANPAASGADGEHVLAQKNDASSPFAQVQLGAHINASGAFSSDSFGLVVFNGSAQGVAIASACDGQWHVWIGVRRAGVYELYRSVNLSATASVGAASITQASPARYVAIGSRGNGTANSFVQSVAMAAMFNRALYGDEIRQVLDNPWRLFAPQRRALYAAAFVSSVARQDRMFLAM